MNAMHNPEHDYETVLEHVTWVQRLAYRLCTNAAQAEDVSQESLLSAFREPRRQGSSLRHWLVGVVRNKARMARRSASRRQGLEATARPPEPSPSPVDLIERIATQRSVIKAVMELPEIYRTALLRRYFDDLGPGEIAAIEGVPEATIKTRLRRGLEALRERLASEFGEDPREPHKLLAALVPIAHIELCRQQAPSAASVNTPHGSDPILPSTATNTATASASVGAWLLLSAVAVVILTLGYQSLVNDSPSASQNASGPTSNQRQHDVAVIDAVPDIDRMPAVNATTVVAAKDDDGLMLVHVTALDVHGQPAPSIDLSITEFETAEFEAAELKTLAASKRPATVVARTEANGACDFRQQRKLCQLVANSAKWTTVVPGTVFPYGRTAEVRIIVARRRTVAGIVTDSNGVPIAAARVVYRTASNLGSHIGVPLDSATRRSWSTCSDATGSFVFDGVPELPDAGLWAEAWDHESTHTQVPPSGNAFATCELTDLAATTTWIQGRIRQTNGELATDAVIVLGADTVRSDAEGRFRVDADHEPAARQLWAATVGSAPIAFERPVTGWPKHLNLQFDQPLLTMSGRVVDATGQPRAGVFVDLADPTALAILPNANDGTYRAVSLEHVCLADSMRVATDQHGRFELQGLRNRNYRLILRDPQSLAVAFAGPFAAASHRLELPLTNPADTVRVAGRVADHEGQAIRGAPVYLRHALKDQVAVSARTVTDSTGRFTFANPMPRAAHVNLSAGGGYTAIHAPLQSFAAPENLELTLLPAGSFYLQLTNPTESTIDGFTLEATDGKAVLLQRVDGQVTFTIAHGSFANRRSPVYRAPTGQHVLVLWRNGKQVRRLVLNVRAGLPACIHI